jgi:hypothetical protein
MRHRARRQRIHRQIGLVGDLLQQEELRVAHARPLLDDARALTQRGHQPADGLQCLYPLVVERPPGGVQHAKR